MSIEMRKFSLFFSVILALLISPVSEALSEEPGILSGLVLLQDEPQGAALVRATSAELLPGMGTAQTTDGSGVYLLELPAGEYDVSAIVEDGRSITRRIQVNANDITDLDFLFE